VVDDYEKIIIKNASSGAKEVGFSASPTKKN